MEPSTLLIYACGVFSISFAIFHLAFWKLFQWRKDLQKLSLANRAIIQISNLRLIYLFLLIGVLCFCMPEELSQTKLGKATLMGMSGFWLGRTIEQFVFLRVSNPMVHLLTALFVLGTILFLLPLLI